MKLFTLLSALAALCASLALASPQPTAEKLGLSPEGLRKLATHVVQGQVRAVYSQEAREGGWLVTRRVAEVRVDVCEKGEGLERGDLVYARYWTRRWADDGSPPPSTFGHRELPAQGETLRIYLARNAYDGFSHKNDDGGFNVIGANGFERVPETPGGGGK